MGCSYEVSVPVEQTDLSVHAFLRYMGGISFAHLRVGGTPPPRESSHEFRGNEDLVSLAALTKSQCHSRLVLQSQSIPIVPLVLDTQTEQVADSLYVFLDALPQGHSRETFQSLIDGLRSTFQKTLDQES